MLTETEAWLKLEEVWLGPLAIDCDGDLHVHFNGQPHFGLCACITDMYDIGLINITALHSMRDKIAVVDTHGGYLWPWTEAGAKARAAFCRKQINELTDSRGSE